MKYLGCAHLPIAVLVPVALIVFAVISLAGSSPGQRPAILRALAAVLPGGRGR